MLYMNEYPLSAMATEEVRAEIASAAAQGMKHSERLLKYELERLENNGEPELVEVDIPKPVKVSKRVLIPSHRHPYFNFVGKLLGPGGKTLQGLAKNFKCHVYILGRGSTKDKAKEEEQLNSGDPKYAHFAGPLHVRIETEAPIPIAYTRISGVLNELHRLLQPVRDDLVNQQMEELNQNQGGEGEEGGGGEGGEEGEGGGGRGRGRGRGGFRGRGRGRGGGRGGGAGGFSTSYPGHYGNYGASGGDGGGGAAAEGGGGDAGGGAEGGDSGEGGGNSNGGGFDYSKLFGFGAGGGGGKIGQPAPERPAPY